MSKVTKHDKGLVIQALEAAGPIWRTVREIATDSGLDDQTVRNVIEASGKEFIRAQVPAATGEDLFTARSQLKPLVIKALENPRLKWRTLVGVGVDTRLDAQTVKEVMAACGKEIIKAKKRSPEGEELYTTRAHSMESTAGRRRRTEGV